MRWIGLALVAALLLTAFAAYMNPALFPADIGYRLPQLIWLVLALVLVSGAGYGFMQIRSDRRMILPAILFWGSAIFLIIFLYNTFN